MSSRWPLFVANMDQAVQKSARRDNEGFASDLIAIFHRETDNTITAQ
jgi:hypothetical protein